MSISIEKPENEVQNIELLSSVEDLHGEVTVEIKEPMESKLFALMLGTSLSHWRQQGKRGVWIKLPIEFSNLVEPAVKEGFRYHHAESDYMMLVKWIPDVGLLDQVDMVRDHDHQEHDHQDDQEVKKVLLCLHQDDQEVKKVLLRLNQIDQEVNHDHHNHQDEHDFHQDDHGS